MVTFTNSRRLSLALLSILVLFSLLLGAGGTGCKSKSERREIEPQSQAGGVGNPAIDFSLEDLDGNIISLKGLKGQVVLLNFWATRCRYCVAEMGLLENIHLNYDQAAVVTINVGEKKDKVRQFIDASNFSFPVLLDPKGTLFRAYGFSGYPATVIINQEGIITASRIGYTDEATLLQLLDTAH
ncbi:MAG: TlpA family protein disulfide reductase [Firmicutes bacterium]|nr:TlpA family protein disulfide reductase [Bacillota bacterium]